MKDLSEAMRSCIALNRKAMMVNSAPAMTPSLRASPIPLVTPAAQGSSQKVSTASTAVSTQSRFGTRFQSR